MTGCARVAGTVVNTPGHAAQRLGRDFFKRFAVRSRRSRRSDGITGRWANSDHHFNLPRFGTCPAVLLRPTLGVARIDHIPFRRDTGGLA
jgi:hypothetical protein